MATSNMTFHKMKWFPYLKTIRMLTKEGNKTVNNFDIDFCEGEINEGDCMLEETPLFCFQIALYALCGINTETTHESSYFERYQRNSLGWCEEHLLNSGEENLNPLWGCYQHNNLNKKTNLVLGFLMA